jgi:tetratricopeptide (TPR) repeat protein
MKYRRIVLIIFIVLVGASIIYGLMDHRKVTTSSEKAYQAYLQGEEYMYRLYHREALEAFEQAIKLDPNFAMAHARAAMLYKSFNRDADYEASKRKAISQFGDLKDKEKLIINLWFARADERTADVDKYAAELVSKYPNSFDALEFMAGSHFYQRKYAEAIVQLNKLIEKYPDHAPSYNVLAYSYFNIGEYDKALANIDKYSSLARDQANPHDSHGELLLFLGRYDEALVKFRTADSIKSGLYFVVEHIGATYHAKGMYRDAIGAYLKAAELSINKEIRANIKSEVARCYAASDQDEKAIEILKEIVSDKPDNLRSHAILGGIYAERGELESALIQLGIVKSLTSQALGSLEGKTMGEPSIKAAEYYLEGAISMAKGNYMDAVAQYKQVVEGMPLAERGYFSALVAEANLRAGRPDSAIAVLSEALNLNPNSEICLRYMAEAYGATGQLEAQRNILTRYMAVMKDADEDLPFVRKALGLLL